MQENNAVTAHIAPFITWLVLMALLPTTAWAYAIRAVCTAGLFLYLRPWQYYRGIGVVGTGWAFITGVLVFLIWVIPEHEANPFRSTYLTIGLWPLWQLPEAVTSTPYAPAVCGWTLTAIRILGSALVIAVIEEFFWRSFLYRWLIDNDFLRVDPGVMKWGIFLGVALLFGIEHQRYLVGFIAGIMYGLLYIRSKNIWTVSIAHVTTNLLLGIYVVVTGRYEFW